MASLGVLAQQRRRNNQFINADTPTLSLKGLSGVALFVLRWPLPAPTTSYRRAQRCPMRRTKTAQLRHTAKAAVVQVVVPHILAIAQANIQHRQLHQLHQNRQQHQRRDCLLPRRSRTGCHHARMWPMTRAHARNREIFQMCPPPRTMRVWSSGGQPCGTRSKLQF